MEVRVADSFLKSLKRIGSWEDKWLTFKGWVKYHFFNRNFHTFLKTAFNTYPWDYTFLYELEKAKIEEMRKYHERRLSFVDSEFVVRDMKICENLIDIFLEKKNLFHIDGGLKFEKTEDGRGCRIGFTDDFKYNCDVVVNVKNIDRFVKNKKSIPYYLERPHELYILKAKHLYHKIRFERDEEWWD